MNTPTVTLTTDWGSQSFFSGMVKGVLLRLLDKVQIIDISHRIEAYNILNASFVVRHACSGFPKGTVHIIDIGSCEPFVALQAHGQYYLCADNGIPALSLGNEITHARRLPIQIGGVYNFAAYNLFAPIAVRLLQGEPIDSIGEPYTVQASHWTPFIQQGEYLRIYVQYVDTYGNVYLGMQYSEFEHLREGREFALQVREMEVREVSTSYQQNTSGYGLILTVSATGHLELALHGRSLSQLFGLRVNDSVLLRFK